MALVEDLEDVAIGAVGVIVVILIVAVLVSFSKLKFPNVGDFWQWLKDRFASLKDVLGTGPDVGIKQGEGAHSGDGSAAFDIQTGIAVGLEDE